MSIRIAFDLDGTLADLDSALQRITEELFPAPENGGAAGPAAGGFAAAPAAGPTADYWARAGAAPGADNGHEPCNGRGPHNGREPQNGADEGLSAEEEQLEPPAVRALTRRQQHAIWEKVRHTTDFWETLDETEPGIVARIAALAEERRWEVIFITQRPTCEGRTVQRQTQRWLAAHGFEMPSVYVLPAGASRGKVATALSLDIVVDDRPENCLDVKVDSQARAFLVARDPSANIAANARRLRIEAVTSVGDCLDLLTMAPPEKPGLLDRLKKMMGT